MCDNAEQANDKCYGNSAKYVCVKLNISCDKVSSSLWMDGLIDGCFDGWMDGWFDGWMNGWFDGWVDCWLSG